MPDCQLFVCNRKFDFLLYFFLSNFRLNFALNLLSIDIPYDLFFTLCSCKVKYIAKMSKILVPVQVTHRFNVANISGNCVD